MNTVWTLSIINIKSGLHERSVLLTKTLSDQYMTVSELSLPKKTPRYLHNTVTFRHCSHFEESDSRNDILKIY